MEEPTKKPNTNGKERDEKGRFLPGNSGNPNAKGRPSNELSITVKQREMLPLLCPYSKKNETWLEWLADRGMALAGENATYYKELMERLEGKITQPITPEGPIIFKVIYDRVWDKTPGPTP
jgi:hypothetical protein